MRLHWCDPPLSSQKSFVVDNFVKLSFNYMYMYMIVNLIMPKAIHVVKGVLGIKP